MGAAATLIDAAGLDHRALNERLRAAAAAGAAAVTVRNVNGQRYACAGFTMPLRVRLEGVPGNDLGCFMNGPEIEVLGNAQDTIGNTMGGGRIVVHGNAGDLAGYAMRGGELLVAGDVGYRVGIHMKAYQDHLPTLVAGGTARDYLGEYLAGGRIVILNLAGEPLAARHIGTGMHGGVIYLRGTVEPHQLGREVGVVPLAAADRKLLRALAARFFARFPRQRRRFDPAGFTKLVPVSARPYGNLYAY